MLVNIYVKLDIYILPVIMYDDKVARIPAKEGSTIYRVAVLIFDSLLGNTTIPSFPVSVPISCGLTSWVEEDKEGT